MNRAAEKEAVTELCDLATFTQVLLARFEYETQMYGRSSKEARELLKELKRRAGRISK